MKRTSYTLSNLSKTFLILLPIVLFGIFLRLYKLDAQSLWMDEVATVIYSKFPLSQITDRIAHYQNSPPFHYVAVNIFIRLFGESELIVRLPSVITGFLSIILVYFLGKELFGKTEGIISSLLLTVSPVHVFYSQEARTYSFFIFFMLGSFYFLIRALKTGKLLNWLFFIIFTSLATHTHYFSAFFIVSEVILVIFVLLWKGKQEKSKVEIKKFLRLLVALFIVGFLFIPSFSLMLKGKEYSHGHLSSINILSLSKIIYLRLKEIFTHYSLGNFLYFNFFFILLSIIYGFLRKKIFPFLLFIYLLIPLIAGIVFLEDYGLFNTRYFLPILPIYLLIVADGIVKSAELIGSMTRRIFAIPRINLYIVLVLLLIFVVTAIKPLCKYYHGQKQDYRGGAEYIKKYMNPRDIIISGTFDAAVYVYYFERLDLRQRVRTAQSLSDLSMIFRQYGDSGIWYTYSFGASKSQTPYLYQWIIDHFKLRKELPSLYGAGMSVKIYYCPSDYVKTNEDVIEEEINNLKKKLRKDPTNAMTMNMLAHDYFLLKDYGRTIRWYKEIVKIDPQNDKIKGLLSELQSLSTMSHKDSRYLVSRWINKNIPPNSKIVIAKELMMSRILLDFESKKFEVVVTPQDKILPLSHLGYDYMILTSINYSDKGKTDFYKDLFANTELIKKQDGKIVDQKNFNKIQNPRVYIYKLKEGIEYNEILLKGDWIRYYNSPAENIFYFSADLLKFSLPTCYELEILENGKRLKRINHIWRKTMNGVFTDRGTRGYIYITSTDGSDPNTNGKKYMLRIVKKE